MIAALAFASLFASAASLSVQAGGPGNTIFIDYMQGAYVDDVAMPTEAVTVELWSKLVPVSHFPVYVHFHTLHCSREVM